MYSRLLCLLRTETGVLRSHEAKSKVQWQPVSSTYHHFNLHTYTHINTTLPTIKHHTISSPFALCLTHPASRHPRLSILSHRHEADTNVTLWKIITNKRTADCKQLAPLSGLSLVISLNPGRGQDHQEGGGSGWWGGHTMCRRRK